MSKLSLLAAVAATSVLLTGCAVDGDRHGEAPAATHAPATPSSTVIPSPSPTPEPVDPDALPGALGRCGAQPPRVARIGVRQLVLRVPGKARLPAAVLGRGGTVAVLLHQTDGDGMCGWLGFAARVAATGTTKALLLDLCGYGAAQCPDDAFGYDQDAQVSVAVHYARTRLRARRVVVVGASMGGSVAVTSAAARLPVDSFVDLSGPVVWRGVELRTAARRAEVPGLFAMGRSDGADAYRTTREMAAAGPQGSRFLGTGSGHGYELLQDDRGALRPVGREVLGWVVHGPRTG